MSNIKNDKKIAAISHYNTFKVFEDIYKEDSGREDYWELEVPTERKGWGGGVRLLVFVFILSVLGFGVYPALSYLLKTPYPLLVVAEDNLAPMVEKSDLVLVRGVVDRQEIRSNDLIVFASGTEDRLALAVRRVVDVDKDRGQVTVRGEGVDSAGASVDIKQVVGKVVGEDNPFKIPLMGQLIGYLTGK